MAELQLTTSKIADIHIRVEDYLNDKIQTAADLENVNDLLSRVQQQQELLRKQVKQRPSLVLPQCSQDFSWPTLDRILSQVGQKWMRNPMLFVRVPENFSGSNMI